MIDLLILLGDKDQLASVEAGAVLGDICYFINAGYSPEKAQLLAELTGYSSLQKAQHASGGMADNLCLLQKSYRFDQHSGIGRLAEAVNSGNASSKQLLKLCSDFNDLSYFANNESGFSELDKPGAVFYNPGGRKAFTEALKRHIEPKVKVVELDMHINDPEFPEQAVTILDDMMKGKFKA